MGSKALRRISLGRESVPGTPVAATALWRGTGTLAGEEALQFVVEDIGILAPTDRALIASLLGGVTLDAVALNPQQLPYILSAAVKKVTAGVADDPGSGYVYSYPFALAAANEIQTYTLEAGDDDTCEEIEYGFVPSFTLAGGARAEMTMAANWIGRRATPTSYTPDIAIPDVHDMAFGNLTFYCNDVGEGFGATLRPGVLTSLNFQVTTGWRARFTAEGELYFYRPRCAVPEISCELTYEMGEFAVAERAAARAVRTRAFRLVIEGRPLTTSGTTYSRETVRIDFPGLYTSPGTWGEEDGNDTLSMSVSVRYNPALATLCTITVVNEQATLL